MATFESTRTKYVGKRFGKLVALEYRFRPNDKAYWFCRCDCGNEKEIRIDHLKSGRVISCGCHGRAVIITAALKHGHNRSVSTGPTRTYNCWSSMLQRCRDKNNKSFKNYGGRGIAVCERWLKFENFLEDMGEVPEKMSLDRINFNGNYEPSNCRWATSKQQCRNTRKNRLITYNWETRCVSEWNEILGFTRSTLHQRLFKYKWSITDAFQIPQRHPVRRSA